MKTNALLYYSIFLGFLLISSSCKEIEIETNPIIREKFQSYIWQWEESTGLGVTNQEKEDLGVKFGDTYSIFDNWPTQMYFLPDGGWATKYIETGTIVVGGHHEYQILKGGKIQFDKSSPLEYKLSEEGFLYIFKSLKGHYFSVKYKAIEKITPGSGNHFR